MKIGQLANAIGCSIETIRFYEKQGLLPTPERGSNNFRYYNEEHLKLLSFICYCRTLDISLAEIKQILTLEHAEQVQADEINALLDRHIKEIAKRIHELDHLRMQFIELKGKCRNCRDNNNLMKTLLSHSRGHFIPLKGRSPLNKP